MKIEFADETTSLPLPDAAEGEETSMESAPPEVIKLLSEGIEAAQNGDRAEARHLLLKVTEEHPESETAWLWLASISEYPEELLIFLNNVLSVNPKNERALKWTDETKTLLGKTFIQRGIDAEAEGKKEFAKQCFLQAIVHDNKSELAWMWLASVSDSDEEKVSHLLKVLNLNPESEKAKGSLERAKMRIAKANLTKAKSAFYDGDREKAERFVSDCLANDPKFEEALLLKSELADSVEGKIECLKALLEINPENQSAITAMETAKFDWIISVLSKAKVSIDGGDLEKANELLDDILDESPNVIDALLLKVEAADSFETKIGHLNRVLEIDPDNEFAIQGLEVQKTEKAKSLVQDAKEAFGKKKKTEAKKLVEEALESAPDLEEAILLKCELIDSLDEKTQLLNFVLSKNPGNQSALDQLKAVKDETLHRLLTDARSAIKSDDTDRASEMLQTALEMAPADEDVLFLKFELGNSPAERLNILNEILAINPSNPRALKAISEVNLELANYALGKASAAAASGDKQKAEVLLKEAFGYEPSLENGWMLKAHLSDSFSVKIECFEQVLNVNPENEAAKANLLSLKTIVENSIEDSPSDHEVKIAEFDQTDQDIDEPEYPTVEIVAEQFPAEALEEIYEVDVTDPEVVEFEDTVAESAERDVVPESSETESLNENADEDPVDEEPAPILMPNSASDLDLDSENPNEEFDSETEDDSLIEINNKSNDREEDSDSIDTKTKQVLIVDDSATIRKLISGKLEKSGLQTICAVDGLDALDKIEEFVPDLVLLDIAMPRMDGYQVCKIIRENEATKDIPVIMVSGKDGFFDKALGKLAGSTSYISKPFGPEALMKIVNEHLI